MKNRVQGRCFTLIRHALLHMSYPRETRLQEYGVQTCSNRFTFLICIQRKLQKTT